MQAAAFSSGTNLDLTPTPIMARWPQKLRQAYMQGACVSTPNIFMLFVDSLRGDAVFGNGIATPTFDARTRVGAPPFTSACALPRRRRRRSPRYSPVATRQSTASAVCRGYRLTPDITTIAEAFGRAGYRSYAEVTGPLLAETGVLRGFDDVRHREGYKAPFFGWRDDVPRPHVGVLGALAHASSHLGGSPPLPAPARLHEEVGQSRLRGSGHGQRRGLGPVLDSLPDNTIVVLSGDHGEEYPDGQFEVLLNRVSRKGSEGPKAEELVPLSRSQAVRTGRGPRFRPARTSHQGAVDHQRARHRPHRRSPIR